MFDSLIFAHYVTGKYVALPAVESTQGQRMDLEAVRTAIHDGKSLAELHAEHFEASQSTTASSPSTILTTIPASSPSS